MKKLALLLLVPFLLLTDTQNDKQIIEAHAEPLSVERVTAAPVVKLPEVEVVEPEVPEPIDLGEYKLTAYCSCDKCCGKWADNRPDNKVVGATGEELIAGYSIAVDPEVIPYGSLVSINGNDYEAMDCGGAIKGNRVDVYFNSHKEALNFGVQYAHIFLYQ